MSRWPSGSTSSPADHLPSRLNRTVTQRGGPVQDPDLVLVVVAHRIVHGCAVVPHDDVVLRASVADSRPLAWGGASCSLGAVVSTTPGRRSEERRVGQEGVSTC